MNDGLFPNSSFATFQKFISNSVLCKEFELPVEAFSAFTTIWILIIRHAGSDRVAVLARVGFMGNPNDTAENAGNKVDLATSKLAPFALLNVTDRKLMLTMGFNASRLDHTCCFYCRIYKKTQGKQNFPQ